MRRPATRCRRSPSTSRQGVRISVRTVAKVRPPAMAVDSWVHHCDDGAPILNDWCRMSIFHCSTIGIRPTTVVRSEEHTSELQSRENLVCRLLLEKKKKRNRQTYT